jgi:hypothetical protein
MTNFVFCCFPFSENNWACKNHNLFVLNQKNMYNIPKCSENVIYLFMHKSCMFNELLTLFN